jgi:hypothetical protein
MRMQTQPTQIVGDPSQGRFGWAVSPAAEQDARVFFTVLNLASKAIGLKAHAGTVD